MSCTSLVKTLSGICHGKDGLVQSRALTVPDHQLCLAMPCCPCWHQDTCLAKQEYPGERDLLSRLPSSVR